MFKQSERHLLATANVTFLCFHRSFQEMQPLDNQRQGGGRVGGRNTGRWSQLSRVAWVPELRGFSVLFITVAVLIIIIS